MKVYRSFEEISSDIQNNTPPIIYKYRTWGIADHEKVIKNLELWFPHPHTLNDPYDVRPPYNFIVGEIDWDAAKVKIREAGRYFEPDLTDEELEIEVEIRLESIKQNPVDYFKKTRGEYVLEKSNYEKIGILSCCLTFDNEAMWAYYGNNHSGFAIGFNTVELAKALNCSLGYVDYNDTPVDYYIMGNNQGILEAEIFKKSTKWSTEQELRFATAGIGIYRQRANNFPINSVEEIVLGISTSKETEENIIKEASITLTGIPIYKLQTKTDSYGFDKVRIK